MGRCSCTSRLTTRFAGERIAARALGLDVHCAPARSWLWARRQAATAAVLARLTLTAKKKLCRSVAPFHKSNFRTPPIILRAGAGVTVARRAPVDGAHIGAHVPAVLHALTADVIPLNTLVCSLHPSVIVPLHAAAAFFVQKRRGTHLLRVSHRDSAAVIKFNGLYAENEG